MLICADWQQLISTCPVTSSVPPTHCTEGETARREVKKKKKKERPWCFLLICVQLFVREKKIKKSRDVYVVGLNVKTCFRTSEQWLPASKSCVRVYQTSPSKVTRPFIFTRGENKRAGLTPTLAPGLISCVTVWCEVLGARVLLCRVLLAWLSPQSHAQARRASGVHAPWWLCSGGAGVTAAGKGPNQPRLSPTDVLLGEKWL